MHVVCQSGWPKQPVPTVIVRVAPEEGIVMLLVLAMTELVELETDTGRLLAESSASEIVIVVVAVSSQ